MGNVNDLISRQAAIDLWDKYHPTIAVNAIRYDAELRQLPSAQLIKSDIIQCRYCTHHVPPAYCKENDGIWRPFDYCSKAERKKDGFDL